MKRVSLKRVGILFLLVFFASVLLAIPFHYWTVDRKGFLRTLYPVTALFSSWTTKCSENAPQWQSEIMSFGLWKLRAPASQSAFIDSEGKLHHCESGWQEGLFSSALVTEESLFQYGSVTKPITSAFILSLVDQGELGLDWSVVDIFSAGRSENIPDSFNSITVGKLMTYQAGVTGEAFVEKEAAWCPTRMGELYNQKPWVLKDGVHRYSNLSYCILGALISEVAGGDFRDVINDAFDLESYGVKFVDGPSPEAWVTPDYRYHDFYRDDLEPSFDYQAISATGGLGGSAMGYARLMRDLIDSSLSNHFSQENESCDSSKMKNCYGYMFFRYKPENGKILYLKEGHMPGFSSLVAISENREVFVWVGNSDTPNARAGVIMKEFIDLLSDHWL